MSRRIGPTTPDGQRRENTELKRLNLQVRNLSARALARLEQDRTRLAREVHDQLGQLLAALKIDLVWLHDRIAADVAQHGAPAALVAKIDTMTRLVDDTIHGVRRIASELRPPVLDRLGLAAAIEWQADDFKQRTGVDVALRLEFDPADLDPGRSTTVFRIFQEILTNVAAHARATLVTVSLATTRRRLVLTVADDGCGIAPQLAPSNESLGLLGMHERAGLLGGEVSIRPVSPHGTSIAVTIPVADRRRSTRVTR